MRRYGPQNFLFFAPPPVERHVNVELAFCWQNVAGSIPAGTSAVSQLRTQYV